MYHDLPWELPELSALLLDVDLPERVPVELVRAATRAKVVPVVAARERAREVLGKNAVNDYLSQAALGALRLQEFREIVAAMDVKGIDVVPLKGMAYGLMFESGGPVRAMADIDILVRPKNYKVAGEVMKSLGYQEVFQDPLAKDDAHHERQFAKDGRLVEIHRYFLRGHRITVDYNALWERTLPLQTNELRCLRLSPEDTLLYHCFHMGIHEFALGGLMSVWELRRLILEDLPDQRACVRRAQKWSTRRITWCALRLLETCFPDTLGHETRIAINKLTPTPLLRIMLEKYVIAPSLLLLASPGPLPRPVQLFRKALLVDSAATAAAYLLWYIKSYVLYRTDK